eukprot:scaffold114811_cov14-Tisochrysis_lutea.AAC.1
MERVAVMRIKEGSRGEGANCVVDAQEYRGYGLGHSTGVGPKAGPKEDRLSIERGNMRVASLPDGD